MSILSEANERLRHQIRCLENKIEHFENISSEYKYVWDKKWKEMTEIERDAYYKAIPAAKLTPVDIQTTEEYLREHSVLDGMGNMDGEFVPLSVAMIAIQRVLDYDLCHEPPSWIRPNKNNE